MKRWAFVHCRPLLWLLTIGERRRAEIERRKRELEYEWAASLLEEQLAAAYACGRTPNEWLRDALELDRANFRWAVLRATLAQRNLPRSTQDVLLTPFGPLNLSPLYDA